MYELIYDILYKGGMWTLSGAICLTIGVGLASMILFVPSYNRDDCIGYTFMGIALIAFGVFSIYMKKNSKEKIDKDLYRQMAFIRECNILLEKKREYLEALKTSDDYFALTELYDRLPELYSNYGSAVLTTPLRLTKPTSPYTAAIVGTQIGGVAVGMVAAQNAIEKQKAYEKNVLNVIEASLKQGNAFDKAMYCFESIENIIRKDFDTKNDWYNEKEKIEIELKKKYRVD